MRLVSRSGLIATALVAGAIASPAALADPSHSGWNPAPSGWVVRPNPDHQAPQAVRATAAQRTPSGSGAGAAVTLNADRIAAERAAASMSAPLDRFALVTPRNITPTTTLVVSRNSDPGFQFGDAAIGAGVAAGLVLLGTVGMVAGRRRRQPLHT